VNPILIPKSKMKLVFVVLYLTTATLSSCRSLVAAWLAQPSTSSTSTKVPSRRYVLGNRCSRPSRRLPATTTTGDDNNNNNKTTTDNNKQKKTLYQRVFYRLSAGSDVDVHNAMVVEERVRFVTTNDDFDDDPDQPTSSYMVKPSGPRTIILRDGDVEDGEIGNEFLTLDLDLPNGSNPHSGAGTDSELESSICTALYLASNPSLCRTGSVLEVACGSGLASLLGCIGAGFILNNKKDTKKAKEEDDGIDQDILTIAKEKPGGLFPNELKMLTLTNSNAYEDSLQHAMHYCKRAGVTPSKVSVERLDWNTREVRPRGLGQKVVKEYATVVASDVAFSYPETKELARTVAHRLAPTAWYDTTATTVPRFVHVCPESRQDVPYLHRILNQGYRMTVATAYLKLEKLQFVVQRLPESAPESALDEEELEVQDVKEMYFLALIAQHHPDYVGEGSGELFFPMETGEYEVRSGSTYLEPDAGGSPW
jgi:hypothetical protein